MAVCIDGLLVARSAASFGESLRNSAADRLHHHELREVAGQFGLYVSIIRAAAKRPEVNVQEWSSGLCSSLN